MRTAPVNLIKSRNAVNNDVAKKLYIINQLQNKQQ